MKEYIVGVNTQIAEIPPVVACIGYFDGIHKGHQALIDQTVKTAHQKGIKSAMITFSQDPWIVINKISSVPQLMCYQDRNALIEKLGIDLLIILDFTCEMASLKINEFHDIVLMQCHINTLICGFDFHYAYQGDGDARTLASHSIWEVITIPEIKDHDQKISSTLIEQCIKLGNIEAANHYLGRNWEVLGKIVKGSAQGRQQGFPTANLRLAFDYVIPKLGVYAIDVIINQRSYPAICNVGHNPTFNYQEQVTMEAYIFDFNQDIYQQICRFRFKKMLRSEIKFENKQALYTQIKYDIDAAKKC